MPCVAGLPSLFFCRGGNKQLNSRIFDTAALCQDYPLSNDIDLAEQTPIIYAWRSGEGIGKHANSRRGSAQVNFQDGSVIGEECNDAAEYYALHGALLLLAWMVIAPYGIYQAR